MKKIIIATVAIFALLIPVKAKHVYFNDGFGNFLKSKNLSEADSKIDQILYRIASSPFAETLPDTAYIFGYFPNYGLNYVPDRVNTFTRIASSWQKLNGHQENWVAFDWKYEASNRPNKNIIIGIEARVHPDSAWTRISEIKGDGGGIAFAAPTSGSATGLERMTGKIPAEFISGKDSVQVAIYFNYSDNENLKFLFYFDNFLFVSYGDVTGQPRASVRINSPGVMLNPNDVIVAKVQNESDVVIKKVRLAYTVNGGVVKYQDTILPDSLNVLKKTSFRFNPEGLVTASGDNPVKVWIAGLNEMEFLTGEGGDTVDFSIHMPDSAEAIYPTKFLVEHFTGSTCNPCNSYNAQMNPCYKDLEEQGKIVYVKYQMDFPGAGDPYYVAADGGVRADYYKVSTIPSSFGNADKFNNAAELRTKVNSFVGTAGAKSYFDVSLDFANISPIDSNIYVKYKIIPKITAELNVHTVVFEKITYWNRRTNGESSFPHVTMKMFPNGKGNIVNFKKDSVYEFIYEYDMSKTFMERIEDLELAVFIQRDKGGEILHATQRSVSHDSIPETANETYANVFPVKVSPNPASEYVNVKSPEDARVFLYSSTGIPVYEGIVKANIIKTISLATYAKGIYVLRVVSNKGVAVEKIIKQ
jgi:hypothetical protein